MPCHSPDGLANVHQILHNEIVRQFAWPYGDTRAELKPRLGTRFDAVRGIHAGVNVKGSDLMQLGPAKPRVSL